MDGGGREPGFGKPPFVRDLLRGSACMEAQARKPGLMSVD